MCPIITYEESFSCSYTSSSKAAAERIAKDLCLIYANGGTRTDPEGVCDVQEKLCKGDPSTGTKGFCEDKIAIYGPNRREQCVLDKAECEVNCDSSSVKEIKGAGIFWGSTYTATVVGEIKYVCACVPAGGGI